MLYKTVCLVALIVAYVSASRLPIPYELYVQNGGLPIPVALRTGSWYNISAADDAEALIVGGSDASAGDAPHIVSLAKSSHFCGGSILDAETVITAAHCIDGTSASSVKVRAGSLKHSSGGQQVSVKTIRKHSQYNSYTIDYDIAILKLSTPLTLDGQNVKGVQLPANGELDNGQQVLIAGWGTTRAGASTLPTNLQKVNVNIVERTTCNGNYGSGSITQRMICAAVNGGGKDACQGDSGGPLTQGGVLYGVVSWGRSCALPDYPGVYSNVAALLDWITTNRA
ncbi:trypsin Blo t 3-like [Oppia nitens]|uniref:trypsin Blo t 3-like n=1 Tax=Oppia nitens TaxID=1686743 RepID=UPI0023DC9FFE|nr:trypsin Blo t 3-like [Oppia nitens]